MMGLDVGWLPLRHAWPRSREPRTAAFLFGVLEFLRRIEVTGPPGQMIRLVDQVGVIPGFHRGSFTALPYGLYGDDRPFGEDEQRLLKPVIYRGLTDQATVRPPAGAGP